MSYLIGLITAIHILVCLFLIIVVLLQSGKSGDIAAAFGGHGQPDRVRSTRRGDRTFQGHHVVGSAVHGHVDHAVDFCRASQRDNALFGICVVGREAEHDEYAASKSYATAHAAGIAAQSDKVI